MRNRVGELRMRYAKPRKDGTFDFQENKVLQEEWDRFYSVGADPYKNNTN